MFDLSFEILSAEPLLYAAVPQLVFKLRIANRGADVLIQNIALRCQIQIESAHRRYQADEQKRLRDLFDEPSRWSQTLKTMLWTHVNVNVPSFTDAATIDVPVECSFDFNIAATKYFAALETGEIPLLFQFSGTAFYTDEAGALQIAQIPWSAESKFRLPVEAWRQMMDVYYPNSAWLRLRRDVFDSLYEFKVKNGIPTWEQALEKLLESSESRL
jgi:hypothetical protein